MVSLVEPASVAHDPLMLTRRTNVFFALLGPERTAIGLVRIRQGSGLVEQFDDASRTWRAVPDARFAEDLNADSLDLVEAVLALEEEWNIDIPEEEMEGVKTVGQAVALVEHKLGAS